MSSASLAKPGTLVQARGREWVVLPESTDELLIVRPVGGLDEEITGILPAIEPVESATFAPPTKDDVGDFASGRLLRDAARLSTRAAAGPFRSFARINVEPRPYQLVPLMMALKLDPVRLLIADDVGIGKTVEAGLIARELLDRGEIRRMTVLCPPHLAEQWQRELAQKFHIDAELILSSTIQRLERNLPLGVSVFDRHRFTIVSTDFIKGEHRAEDFANKCPEFVIVDEAHGCTVAGGVGRGQQQRFELIQRISQKADRHMVLVTATPHSGNEGAFRSLLSLLDPEFADLPEELETSTKEAIRRKLARHLVQRRRDDIRAYLETDTKFPARIDREVTYSFNPKQRELLYDIVAFAQELVKTGDADKRTRRVQYWSALALLRCVSSSPAAAVATLTSRSGLELLGDAQVDEYGRRTVLDIDDLDSAFEVDLSPGAETDVEKERTRKRMLEFSKRAQELSGKADAKLQGAIKEIRSLVNESFRPIVFCRFMDTADYVARELRKALPEKIRIESITGALPPAEREARIEALTKDGGEYVLVCTDCLSEGVNLQHAFSAVIHYDLCWNPTRHEQREGRVDRFGQERKQVQVITYFGNDNPIDGVILHVLIRKHKRIKSDLGVTVAVPGSSEKIAETLFEGALFREMAGAGRAAQLALPLDIGDEGRAEVQGLHSQWDKAAERETKRRRSRFAQDALDKDAVAAELASVREAIGGAEDVARFVRESLQVAKVPTHEFQGVIDCTLSPETPRSLRQAIGLDDPFKGRFEWPLRDGDVYLGRTSPVVEGLASWVLDQALDPVARDAGAPAARTGVIASHAVEERTTLLVTRFRYHLSPPGSASETILCEEIVPLAYRGDPNAPEWLLPADAAAALAAVPSRNLVKTAIDQQLDVLADDYGLLPVALDRVAGERASAQLTAHERVRAALKGKGRASIEPVLPVDIIGAYVLLPSR